MAIIKIVGTVVEDADFRVSKAGKPVFSLCVAENVQKKEGKEYVKSHTNFYNLVCFGEKAEETADENYCKGDFVEVTFFSDVKNKKTEPKDGEKYGKTLFYFEGGLIRNIERKTSKKSNKQTNETEDDLPF